MHIRGPEWFFSVWFADDHGFYPVGDLFVTEEWPIARCLGFAMGGRPIRFGTALGYGAFLEHEDFWIFGRTPEEVERISEEWPIDD